MKEVDRALSEPKPAKARGVMLASVPTTMTASACPARRMLRATPRAWAEKRGHAAVVRLLDDYSRSGTLPPRRR